MKAREISWDEWRAEREGLAVPPTTAGDEHAIAELAGEDFQALRSCMRRAGKRRAVPPSSSPLELWDMILSPERELDSRGQ
eukprot:2822636-Pyramimonas_sp.AAC.1